MSDKQYHIMRMNGLSPSGLPVSEKLPPRDHDECPKTHCKRCEGRGRYQVSQPIPGLWKDCERCNGTGKESVDEIAALKARNTELHRRCQQAEAAVASFKKQWDQHGGPCGGSFGRALLASYCVKLEARAEKLDTLIGNILACLRLNLLHETIKTTDDADFKKIIEGWQKQREQA